VGFDPHEERISGLQFFPFNCRDRGLFFSPTPSGSQYGNPAPPPTPSLELGPLSRSIRVPCGHWLAAREFFSLAVPPGLFMILIFFQGFFQTGVWITETRSELSRPLIFDFFFPISLYQHNITPQFYCPPRNLPPLHSLLATPPSNFVPSLRLSYHESNFRKAFSCRD